MAFERITVDHNQMGGLPCIRGLRIPVTTVLDQLAAGRTQEEIIADFPDLGTGGHPHRARVRRLNSPGARTAAPQSLLKLLLDATITTSGIRAWWASLAARSRNRAAKSYRLLRTILGTAVVDNVIGRNPCQVAGAGQDHAPERPTASPVEVAALSAAMPKPWVLAVELAAWCDLRKGELLTLRRRDIDLAQGLVRIERSMVYRRSGAIIAKEPKTAAGRRRVGVPPPLLPLLARHLGAPVGADPEALLFTGDKGGPLRPYVLQAAWDKARRQVGRMKFHFHDLRHSGNAWAATTGASTAELMARMGHASPVSALRYQHATEQRDRAVAEALSTMAPGNGEAEAPGPREDARWSC